jgi:hypothetical protein
MNKLLSLALLAWIAVGFTGAAADTGKPQPQQRVADPKWLHQELERVRAKDKLPALAACLVVGDKVVAASAVGFRKVGDPKRVT